MTWPKRNGEQHFMDYQAYLSKAEESLATAEDCLTQERYNSCANRCYYAMFQAAVATLIKLGSIPKGDWTHKYVGSSVAGYLIKQRKLLPTRFGGLYREAERIRHKGDYEVMNVTRREAAKTLRAS
jgi:uncharacterized protein (UPF0332 family)